MTEPAHKVRIKIGANEFEAEGDKATVEAQVQQFFALVNAVPAAPAPRTPTPADNAAADPPGGGDPLALPQAILDVSFNVENGIVSLRVLPKTKSFAADSLVMLLYGHKYLQGEGEVLGGKLMKGAKQSGLQIDRVDRVLDLHRDLIIKGGARKGARYGLNNRGITKAKEMLEKLRE